MVLAVRKIDAIAQASCEIVRKSAHDAGHPDAKIELRAANLDDPTAVVALAATFASEPLDVIVHCASRYDARAIGEIDAEYALSHYRTNALAPLLLTQALRGQLSQSILPAGGSVVCFTDMHAQGRMYTNHAAYFASKGALIALVESLAVELAPSIRVNGIAPGLSSGLLARIQNFRRDISHGLHSSVQGLRSKPPSAPLGWQSKRHS